MAKSANAIMREILGEGRGSVGARVLPRRIGVRPVAKRNLGARASRIDADPAQDEIHYTQNEYDGGDVTYLGFGFFQVPATPGLLTPFNTNKLTPTRPFTPQKLFAPSTMFGLYILSVSIEGRNIFASDLGIAIELFSEASYFPQMDWPTIDPSTGISFSVANPGNIPLNFAPAFYGTDVYR